MFRGDYETGSWSQWSWGAQCLKPYGDLDSSEPTIDRGWLHVVTDTIAQGTYAARFDLPASTLRTACEVLRHRTVGGDGTDEYYALEQRYPSDWQEPSPWGWGGGGAQFNYVGGVTNIGPPVGLTSHANRVNITLQTGPVSNNASAYSSGWDGDGNISCTLNCRIVPEGELTRGVWHQFIVHIHWATNSSGLVETWWKRKGESTWNPEARATGAPTLQWLASTGPMASSADSSDKVGFYRGGASFPLSIWNDAFCAASSFSAAASCL